MVYEARYRERNDCGWGPVNVCRLETMNCDGGEEPFRQAPGPATPEAAAYPNPAHDYLTLEQGGGAVRLANTQGKLVRSLPAKPGILTLDTRSLPIGMYYLEMRNKGGQPVRLPIRIVH